MASNVNALMENFRPNFLLTWIKWVKRSNEWFHVCTQTNVICLDLDTRMHTCMYLFRIEESHYRLVEWWMMDSENIHHEMCRFSFETNERGNERKTNRTFREKGTESVWTEWHLMSFEMASKFGNCIENDYFVLAFSSWVNLSCFWSKRTKSQVVFTLYLHERTSVELTRRCI